MTACSPLDKVISIFKDDGSNYIFKISISDDPENLDPQIASDISSVMIAKNMFVGLLRLDENGRISSGVAKDYTISSDGLKYVFNLDDRYKWTTSADFEADVTANDFVFAFKRLFNPETGSEYADEYFCIKGSKQAYEGRASLDDIGVKALDDYTLEITLEYPNARFLSLLTALPASPCNEEFFNLCRGKYGLEADAIASNGPFYVTYWLHDEYGKNNYVRIRRCSAYSEISTVTAAGVNYLVEKDKSVRLSDFTGGSTNVYIPDDPSVSELAEYNSIAVYTGSAGLIVNPSNEVLSRPEVLDILSMCISRSELETAAGFKAAYGVIPDAAFVGGTRYRGGVNEPEIEENSMLAEYKWEFTLTDDEKLSINGCTIMVPDSFLEYNLLSSVTDMWYDALGLTVNIEVVNQSDYERRLENSDYDICLMIVESQTLDAYDYIFSFSSDEGAVFDEACKKAYDIRDKYTTLTEAIYDISLAESSLVDNNKFIPLWYLPKFIYCDDETSGITYDPFTGAIMFEKAAH